MPKSARWLRYHYLKWNREFFDDALPKDAVIRWEPVEGGVAESQENGIEGLWLIRIDPCLRAKKCLWSLALFHEMVHIHLAKTNPKHQHGKTFEKAMLSLAERGAFKGLW